MRRDQTGARNVRTSAQIGEIRFGTLLVKGHRFVVRQALDQFSLVLILALVALERLFSRDLVALQRQIPSDDLPHSCLEQIKFLEFQLFRQIEIVIKTVLDHRTDTHLDAITRKTFGLVHLEDGLRHHVRQGVPREVNRLGGLAAGQDLDFRTVRQRGQQIPEFTVRSSTEGLFGEFGSDQFGRIERSCARLQVELFAIGKKHLHGNLFRGREMGSGVRGDDEQMP
jgi:hypothetical protein